MSYSPSSPLPPIRHDIDAYELAPGIVVLYDDTQYAPNHLRIATSVVEYLALLDGTRSAEYLARQAALAGRSFSVEDFLDVVKVLDKEYFLDSPRFRAYKEEIDHTYNESLMRMPAHAGTSYPDDPEELRAMLDGFLAADPNPGDHEPPVAVVAPHIDFRVGGTSYGPAYNALRRSDADTFVIFGVSHQMSYDNFMISRKDFATPLGVVKTDRELVERFRESLPFELTRNEVAHRREHSIEFQVVFLRHIFPDRDFRIVPILTGSLHNYVEFGKGDASKDERLNTLYTTLDATARELGRKVCYIAGADLCHVGKKFGDDFPARSILDEVRRHDEKLLEHAARPDADQFLRSLALNRNRYRVCGVAPIYATLRTARPSSGKILCYDQWDEKERESAVSFASVAYYR